MHVPFPSVSMAMEPLPAHDCGGGRGHTRISKFQHTLSLGHLLVDLLDLLLQGCYLQRIPATLSCRAC